MKLLAVLLLVAAASGTKVKMLARERYVKSIIKDTPNFRRHVKSKLRTEVDHICGSCKAFVGVVKAAGDEEEPPKAHKTLDTMLDTFCEGQKNDVNEDMLNILCPNAKQLIDEIQDFEQLGSSEDICTHLAFCAPDKMFDKFVNTEHIREAEKVATKRIAKTQSGLIEAQDEEELIVLGVVMTAAVVGKVFVGACTAAAGISTTAVNLGACFPADSLVLLENGLKRMEDLRVGDTVLSVDGSGKLTYSPIYMFGHAEKDVLSEYINVHTDSGVMKLSPKHYIPTDGFNYKYAKDVHEGETVFQYANGHFSSVNVTKITKSIESGVYNPHTLNGKIVVDGVAASCYSDWVLDGILPVSTLHYAYDVVFTPHKALSVFLGYFGLSQQLADFTGVSNPTAPHITEPVTMYSVGSVGFALGLPALVGLFAMSVFKR